MRRAMLLLTVLASALSGMLVLANDITHRYVPGDKVNVYVHKVGPYANPQEAYEYYALPYCVPVNENDQPKPNDPYSKRHGVWNQLKSTSIGEYLGGHALRHSGHSLTFASTSNDLETCTTPHALTYAEAEMLSIAARDKWFYQMYLDDLPVWGMVGEIMAPLRSTDKGTLVPHVYTERTLTVYYHKDRIIKVDLTSIPGGLVQITPGINITFSTYIVWQPTADKFHSRFDRYLDQAFFNHQIHWFSLVNSFMMVLFLMGLVALIMLRTLRKDFARYAVSGHLDVEGEGDNGHSSVGVGEKGKHLLVDESGTKSGGVMAGEESGWKQVHGDVFRRPSFLPLLAAILGTGWQLMVITFGVIMFAMAGPLHGEVHEDRGEMQHATICCYSLSSVVAGYASGSFFKRYFRTTVAGRVNATAASGSEWQIAMFLTVILLPTVTFIILSVLNGIALVYGTINYIPFVVIIKVFLLWVFVSVPLCIIGTLVGRHSKLGGVALGKTSSDFPCRVNAIPRPIPDDVVWYGKPQSLIPFAGMLSFGSIFIELYYVLTSLWNYKFYHVYGFLLGMYLILIVVVCMTTIIVVYFSLNAENYHWQWAAFSSGASTAAYVFLYSIYFFLFKTNMTGFLQTMYYFGYMSLIALNLGTLCGTIGHFSGSTFVRTIFQNVKLD